MLKKTILSAAAIAGASSLFLAAPALATAEVADQSQSITTGPGGYYCSPGTSAAFEEGNAFTAGLSGNLTGLDIPITTPATTNGDGIVVSIYATTGGLPTGTALATQAVAAADIHENSTLHVTFATPAKVTAGGTYAFAWKFPTCAGALHQFDYFENTPGAGKQLVNFDGSVWTTDATKGMSFTTYVTAVAAPKASKAALASTGQSPFTPMVVAGGVGLLGLGAVVVALAQVAKRRRNN